MSKPRCGVPDLPNKVQYRNKRQLSPLPFTHLGTKWNSNRVTWKINSFTRQLSEQEQRSAFYRAFKLWSDVTPLTIQQVSGGKADMEISFERYDHGDNSPFDGKATGNTLAHAFQPGTSDISGDTHFDDDEVWTVNSDQGTDLYYAAAHEFGHALGLGHSNREESLMYPLYRDASNLKLSMDDISGIQQLYGKLPTSTFQEHHEND
ncbi:hypothetical protein LOTGIDRAFT_134618 [Lottia gigantea]|uniref:Peptidase metallopeptidase domain-containing protein n=1 Tax=Lottia gigantea TaxID=225164 RepID=V3ZE92_LOTGI|nr:hypothetical protein LOTGIDRAFT_134618 [Lottia gigantea]ESO82367.1 hypothetical protein LOTGIDRAFT_134618 [Lottia gigantea]